MTHIIASLVLALTPASLDPQPVAFLAPDGVEATADLYRLSEDRKPPFIVLFHQAGWSRGEYHEIGRKLVDLGFNCLAVDLRSGGTVNGIANKTAAAATAMGKKTQYVDAIPDMVAAIEYARKHHAEGKVIVWGSSYSAALAIHVAAEHPDLVDGVLSFSPGEYFTKQGKPGDWIQRSAAKVKVPFFVTSGQSEKKSWSAIFDASPSKKKAYYLPDTDGNHGSRALWETFSDSAGYWKAVEQFLEGNFK